VAQFRIVIVRTKSSSAQRFQRSKHVSIALPQFHELRFRFGGFSNSVSRCVRLLSIRRQKSVHRERMSPAMCFTMMAMEFDSASSDPTTRRPGIAPSRSLTQLLVVSKNVDGIFK